MYIVAQSGMQSSYGEATVPVQACSGNIQSRMVMKMTQKSSKEVIKIIKDKIYQIYKYLVQRPVISVERL